MCYSIEIPALAYPEIELIRDKPDAVEEYTSSNLSPAKTGIFNPVVVPLLKLPSVIIPVNEGPRVT